MKSWLIGGHMGFPGAASGKNHLQCRRPRRLEFSPWAGKIPWRKAWQPTPVFLLGESHDTAAWEAAVHRVPKSQTQLKRLHTHTHTHTHTHG